MAALLGLLFKGTFLLILSIIALFLFENGYKQYFKWRARNELVWFLTSITEREAHNFKGYDLSVLHMLARFALREKESRLEQIGISIPNHWEWEKIVPIKLEAAWKNREHLDEINSFLESQRAFHRLETDYAPVL